MEKKSRLAENLKRYQLHNNKTLTEFSEELTIPKSTLQSLMKDGNTTLDTLIRIQTALGITLDELVYGEEWIFRKELEEQMYNNVSWLVDLSAEAREELQICISKAVDLVIHAKECRK